MIRILGSIAILTILLPATAIARQLPEPQIDVGSSMEGFLEPSDINYNELYFYRCIALTRVDNGFVDPECFVNATEEDNTREEANAVSRWVRAGMLFLGSLYATVETIKEIYNTFQNTIDLVESIVSSFNLKDIDQTAYMLIAASDMATQRLRMATRVSAYYSTPYDRYTRYGRIQTLVIRSLALAMDADETAVSASDAATGMSIRISDDGSIRFYDVDGQSTHEAAHGTPPLPSDAPTRVASLSNMAQTALSPIAAMLVEASGPARAAGSATDDSEPVCAFDTDGGEAPVVMFERVAVMAKGAQVSTIAVSSDVRENRDLLKLVKLRERQYDLERARNIMITSVTLF